MNRQECATLRLCDFCIFLIFFWKNICKRVFLHNIFVVGIGSQRPRHPVTYKVAAMPPLPNG